MRLLYPAIVYRTRSKPKVNEKLTKNRQPMTIKIRKNGGVKSGWRVNDQ